VLPQPLLQAVVQFGQLLPQPCRLLLVLAGLVTLHRSLLRQPCRLLLELVGLEIQLLLLLPVLPRPLLLLAVDDVTVLER
jgi:hypothetical protein